MQIQKESFMKIYLALILSIFFISCKSEKGFNYDNDSINSLHKLEEKLYSNPSIVLDSILVFNHTISDVKAINYSNLLYTIAYEQKFGVYNNDSLINKAAQEFKKIGDNYNYSRALLYTAISQRNNKSQDSAAHHNIILAESLFKKNHISDYNLNATLYLYLGRFYRSNSNLEMASQALEKSLENSKNANNKNAFLNASLELFNLKLINQKYVEALNIISCFGDETNLPPHIEYAFYNSAYNYYSAKKEPRIAIEYLKKILAINPSELKITVNNPKTYHQLATLYKRIDMKDSSLLYSKAAVSSITDSSAQDSHFYYKHLADILYENKQYKEATELYKSAHFSYIRSFTKFSQQRDLEIKARFNFDEQEKQKNSLKSQRTLFLNLLFILTALFILVSLLYFFNDRKNREVITKLNQDLSIYNRDLKKSWIIAEIYKSTSHILPQLINDVYHEAVRSRKVSKEIFESLNKIVDTSNSASRSSLADITNREQFIHIFGNIYNLDSLTDFEKLVYALNEEGYSNSEIANFLNSSQSSIRTIRGKVLRKMQKTEADNDIEV